MKKIDIEKQLAEHPHTVFRIAQSDYLITRIVKEKNTYNKYADPTWRVYVKFVGLHPTTQALRVGDEYSYTHPLSKVDYIQWNNLEEARVALIEEHEHRTKTKAEEQDRRDKFPAVRQEMEALAKWFGFDKMWVDDPWGSDRIKIQMSFNDVYKLIALMQASLNTEVTA